MAGLPSRSRQAKAGDRGGDRTHDHMIKSHVLYQLSYTVNSSVPSK